MDVFSMLDGQGFVWDTEKASSNLRQHGVSFEQAREAFLDPMARYEDASPMEEARQACIGVTIDYRLLYFVHMIRERRSAPPRLRTTRGTGGEGDAMKMTERIRRNMQPGKPMTMISLRLPEHVIDDLKEVAPSLGFGGYQALIRAYISNGLRQHLAQREAERAANSTANKTVEEFSRRLIAHGVPKQAIQQAVAEMRSSS